MREFGKLITISIISIIFIPALITIMLSKGQPIGSNPLELEKSHVREEELIGMIAKAIPITYEEEALKAQAIMIRSHMALKKREQDIIQDIPSMSPSQMQELWGSDYTKNYSKIKKAVEDTSDMIITYDNEPISLVYHLQSSGNTQSSLDIWDMDVPYLQGSISSEDQKAPNLVTKKEYQIEEIINKVNQYYNETVLEPYGLESQIQIIEKTKDGYIKSIQVGNQLMRGDDFRKILNLRSSCFTYVYNGSYMEITTKGAGHGVGLSQYGANEMAKMGKTHLEILNHYFTGIKITKNII